jgi:hypothetical protein
MAIWCYFCKICGESFKTKKTMPKHCGVESNRLLTSPATKFMEKEAGSDKSTLVNADKIYLERSRAYSRDHEMGDLVEMNKEHTNAETQGWIVDGRLRKKIDDL